jgi:hypothetical protein
MRKLLIRLKEFSGNSTSSHPVANQEVGEGNYEFSHSKRLCSYFEGFF